MRTSQHSRERVHRRASGRRIQVGLCLLTVAVSSSLLSAQLNRVYYTRLAPSRSNLFISNADGSYERQLLPSTSLDYNPSWSRDGQWIAFASERDGSADLYRIKPDGTGLERLTDSPAYDDQPAFSPDGRQVVFVSTRAKGHANLWVLNLQAHRARPLTAGSGGDLRPSWSPDGQWIAFSSDRGNRWPMARGRWEHLQLADVYVIRPDGSGLKRLTEHGHFCGSPKWSSDGKRLIAYCMSAEETVVYRHTTISKGETRLVWIDVASGAMNDVAAGPGVKIAPTVLPSGEIGYVRRDAGAPGIFYRQDKPGPKGADLRAASWSPDGGQVVYQRVGQPGGFGRKLWSRNPKYELFFSAGLASFDPSGGRYVTGFGNDVLLLVDSSNNAPQPVYRAEGRNILGPSWSPRGNTILFGLGAFNTVRFQGDFSADRADGGAQVAMVKPDGTGFREITSGDDNNGFPSFAPDGKRFVYRTFGQNGQGLRIMDLDTNKVTTLTSDYDNFPLWSPRGDLIAFVRRHQGDYEIFTIRPDGRGLRRLTYSPGNDSHGGWSPDGEWILFSSSRMGFKDEGLYTDAVQPYGELFVMRYDGTRVERLTDNQWEDSAPMWEPARRAQSKQ